MEESISNGVKVPEIQITTLIEMLMMQAIKLDTIVAEGDASTQKILQVIIITIFLFTFLTHIHIFHIDLTSHVVQRSNVES